VQLEYTIENNQFDMTVLPKFSNKKPAPQIINLDDSEDETNGNKKDAMFGKQVKPKLMV
jgi:hypothetical protein